MLNGMTRAARLSKCGTYRWTLARTWDPLRQALVVVMFGPSDADDKIDDPTITLLCHIAAHNGYGCIVVVNGIPLRSSKTEPQYAMLEWDKTQDWGARDALQSNLAEVTSAVQRAGHVLIAWGALAGKTVASADWFDNVREEIQCALPEGVPLLCLGKTKAGYPLHPMARGKLKVPKDAKLLPWSEAA